MTAERLLNSLCLLATLLASVLLPAELTATPSDTERTTSRLSGIIRNEKDEPVAAARIWLVARTTPEDGNGLHQEASNEKGEFEMDELTPGLYALRVSLPDYSPVIKDRLILRPGEQRRLDIALRPLPAHLREKKAKNGKGQMEEDWEWVLRMRAAVRSVLRFLPTESARAKSAVPNRPGQVGVSVGFGPSGLLADSVATQFAYELPLQLGSSLLLSGAASYEEGTSAILEARWTPAWGRGPKLSLMLLESSLPESGPARQWHGYRVAVSDSASLPGGLKLDFTVGYVAAHLDDSAELLEPSFRVRRQLSSDATLAYVFSHGAAGGDRYSPLGERENGTNRWSDAQKWLPLSRRDGAPRLERATHQEIAAEYQLGSKGRLLGALFFDQVQDAVLTGERLGAELNPDEFLPDFSGQHFIYDGGHYAGVGVRAGYGVTLFNRFDAVVSYVYGTGLAATENAVVAGSDLRERLQPRAAHAVTARLATSVPGAHTKMRVGYRWVSARLLTTLDAYDPGETHADPYLELQLRQPVPSVFLIPRGLEVIAHVNNLFAQGQVPVVLADGGLVQMGALQRSFRGGLAFSF